ncbi:hypothetical protein [Ensifer oleiphilus]|nr:hypothetical protein [Ensifer oleiphilus]
MVVENNRECYHCEANHHGSAGRCPRSVLH